MDNWQKNIIKRVEEFQKELEAVCKKAGRDPSGVKIVYATKYLASGQFVAFIDIMRQRSSEKILIGENRVQDAEVKANYIKELVPTIFARGPLAEIRAKLKMVMIGNLQKNKINKAISLFDEIHAVDSMELARGLEFRLTRKNKVMPIFLEVNISGEESKHGIKLVELDNNIKSLKSLKISGLMTMAPLVKDPEEVRPIFHTLRQLADRFRLQTSMGMSNDWKIAVEEGADIIRIGGRIFL